MSRAKSALISAVACKLLLSSFISSVPRETTDTLPHRLHVASVGGERVRDQMDPVPIL